MKRVTEILMIMMMGATAVVGGLPEYKELCSALGAIPGWTAQEKCEGMKMTGPMGEFVTATQQYVQNNASLKVVVMSGMQAAMMWNTYASGMQMESDEALMKIEKIGDFTVGITYDKKERSGGIVIQLAPNAVLVGNFEGMEWSSALEAMKMLDWEKLAALFT